MLQALAAHGQGICDSCLCWQKNDCEVEVLQYWEESEHTLVHPNWKNSQKLGARDAAHTTVCSQGQTILKQIRPHITR
jgi:hypothetical protein